LLLLFRYRDRYWRESVFTGVDGIKESLTSVYGSGKVSVANAAMRWMVHHSQLDPKYGGIKVEITLLYAKLRPITRKSSVVIFKKKVDILVT